MLDGSIMTSFFTNSKGSAHFGTYISDVGRKVKVIVDQNSEEFCA